MYSFAKAFVNPASSPIRDLFKYLSDPEMISFAGGYPDPALFDVTGLEKASTRAYANSLSCLQYGNTDGTPQIKTEIMRLMQKRSVVTQAENIVVTTGSQQAFDLLLRVLIDEGDLALVENPTYPTNIQALRVHGARLMALPCDAQGLDVIALEQLLNSGARPKLLYTVPTFGNPSGSCMSLARRLRLLELAAAHGFVLVEDDPYGDLRFSGESLPSLAALAPQVPGANDWVVHMASLSKIVAPGLRVAWSVAPAAIAHRCYVAKQSADVGSSPWTQSIAAEYLASDALHSHLDRIRDGYRQKCAALCQALSERLGHALHFEQPQGGMFVWARLSHGLAAAELLKHALERKVMFVPGTGFHVDSPDVTTLRLSFAAPSVVQIREGVDRLAQAWQAAQA
ncbi:aminotransferase-like domain-containing protein [Comamonas composti]|uniref:aminotransferase-like domain-containing protein n=1 Tax=Comamonas composti TaxID=408558 RepID=UPI0003F9BDB3|nr:PLP-dependent aminotransferase family protein [Comamonas composti]